MSSNYQPYPSYPPGSTYPPPPPFPSDTSTTSTNPYPSYPYPYPPSTDTTSNTTMPPYPSNANQYGSGKQQQQQQPFPSYGSSNSKYAPMSSESSMYPPGYPTSSSSYPPPPPSSSFGPAPLADEHRFAPVKGFRDVWAAILFWLHFIGLIAIAVLTIPKLDFKTAFQNDKIDDKDSETYTGFNFGNREITSLAVGGAFSLILSLCYLFAMRAFPRFLILFTFWGSVAYYLVAGFLTAYFKLYAVTVVFLITAVIYIIFWFVCRKRVPFTAVLLRTVSSVTIKYSGTLWFSFFSLFAELAFIAFLVITEIAVLKRFPGADSTVDTKKKNAVISVSPVGGFLSLYLLFSFYWTSQVIKNVIHVSIAGVFASFYFLKGSPQGMPSFPTLGAFKRAITTSFGSICFGSLLIALIAFVRALLREVANNNDNNGILIFLACCVECLLGWIESLAKLFNTYAFVQVAIYGKPFVRAAKDTWTLFTDRGLEVIVNQNLIGTVLGFGALFVGGLTALITFIVWIISNGSTSINSAATGPLTLSILGAVAIGFILFLLISTVIESGAATTFVCLAEDPAALKATKPELWEQIHKTYPEAAFSNMYT